MSIIFAILLFSFLVFIHELGHFLVAKLSGVQVNEFAIFMGPAIFKKQVGETLYSIRCIPIGGYCAMEGEDEDTESPRSFQKAAWWKRLLILVAGAAMNFLTGLLLLAIVFAPARQLATPVIDSFEAGCTLNGDGGLQEGDRIWKVDGERIYVQSDFAMILNLNGGETHNLVVIRDGAKVELKDFRMEKHTFANEDGTSSERYGMSFTVENATFGRKLAYVWNSARDTVRTVRLSLQMLLTGKAGLKDMSGPVGIVQMMSQTADAAASRLDALYDLLYFGAFIAINLAVMNLLPIPALDGGQILFLLVGGIYHFFTHRRIDQKYLGYINMAGFFCLIALMVVVAVSDVNKLIL